jgi:hypothetical protein
MQNITLFIILLVVYCAIKLINFKEEKRAKRSKERSEQNLVESELSEIPMMQPVPITRKQKYGREGKQSPREQFLQWSENCKVCDLSYRQSLQHRLYITG